MTATFNIAPRWVADTKELGWGTLPTANNSSIGTDLVAWKDFQNLLYKSVAKGKLFNTNIVSTFAFAVNQNYHGGVLSPSDEIHLVPRAASVGQKISANGAVSTYSLVFTSVNGDYAGGVLAPNGDIHFVPNFADRGQKISIGGTVSTYSLAITSGIVSQGGVLSPSGDIYFIGSSGTTGQKIFTMSSPFSSAICLSPWFNKF